MKVFAEMERKTAHEISEALSGANRRKLPLAAFKQHARMQREIKGVKSLQATRDREKGRGFKKFDVRYQHSVLDSKDLQLTQVSEEKVLPAAVRNKKVIPPLIKKLDFREENGVSHTKTDPTE